MCPSGKACASIGVDVAEARKGLDVVGLEEARRAVLRNWGVAERELPSLDRVDAALAALTGVIALRDKHSTVGDPDEGVILLPVPALPDHRLRLGTAQRRQGPNGPTAHPAP